MTKAYELRLEGDTPTLVEKDTDELREALLELAAFKPEATTYFHDLFVANDMKDDGGSWGMYDEGDEFTPFFSEAFLYNLLGKDEARTLRGLLRRVIVAAGINPNERVL